MTDFSQIDSDSPQTVLPADVLDALKNAQKNTTLFAVNPGDQFDGQILKVDELVFSPAGSLTLTARNVPFIIVSAQRWKFADPDTGSTVQLDRTITARHGTKGADGAQGADGSGEVNRQGNPGAPGGPGGSGGDGERIDRPHLYLICGEIQTPDGKPIPGYLRLSVVGLGINGGDGGPGGKGGNGGRGAAGKKGATSAFDCKEGAGRGGSGGGAGQGGQGGRGADGGAGADVTVLAKADAIELFSYARFVTEGGYGGRPGRSGTPGSVGAGGRGGTSNGWCKSGPAGDSGDFPHPIDLGTRGPGQDGDRGDIVLVTVKNLTPIYS